MVLHNINTWVFNWEFPDLHNTKTRNKRRNPDMHEKQGDTETACVRKQDSWSSARGSHDFTIMIHSTRVTKWQHVEGGERAWLLVNLFPLPSNTHAQYAQWHGWYLLAPPHCNSGLSRAFVPPFLCTKNSRPNSTQQFASAKHFFNALISHAPVTAEVVKKYPITYEECD